MPVNSLLISLSNDVSLSVCDVQTTDVIIQGFGF